MADGSSTPMDAIRDNSSWVREKIDPNHTLPEVRLTVSPDNAGGKGTFISTQYDVWHDGKIIGDVRVTESTKRKISFTERIHVDEELRGKGLGFGMAIYTKIIEDSIGKGYTFRSHEWSQTEGAKHLWEILAEKGVATVIEPFKPDGAGSYLGHYEVRPQNFV